ncbi:two-component system response regulator protein-glutamate methylesterase [Duganella sp. Leaf126]|uniref:protein-glutamate methylesterase/protein-glutamine glutaminase n=1 Tax=Duganella sp. Leaf126 TaxID=1736266 RepID=UPI0006F71860|nr:chemotaxis response regulator protein-glutamate methylesterase [Duganella sp. Leaf126]KQQ47707.1 two-component system response regulator protein-glutamate methylesterase [Duganella sp. Leaf126]
MDPIKVMIVDDSAVVRQVLSGLLNAASGITVTYAVANPLLASERMKMQWPDVIVLDVDMPRMDGLAFLRRIMAERPTPVVVCATLTDRGAQTSMEALTAGAVAVVTKPRADLRQLPQDSDDELVAAVRAAAGAHVVKPAYHAPRAPAAAAAPAAGLAPVPEKLSADAVLSLGDLRPVTATTERVVAIGASTGGTQALEEVLVALPDTAPGIVVVQHMPEKFTAAFAARLDSVCQVRVKEAVHNDRVVRGQVLIAPGDKHLLLRRTGVQYFVEVVDGPLVNRHRPSVDVLFRSAARAAGANALGVIMTGMGDDGAAGLLEMLNAGARTLAQDEASCVVYGMPKEAVKRGAVEKSVPLTAIHREIMQQPG